MSIDILECYHKWCFLIGYTNQPSYSVIVIAVYILFNNMMATSLQFQGVCEEDLDKVLNECVKQTALGP